MKIYLKYTALILIFLGLPALVFSQDESLVEILSKNRRELKLENGRLAGVGADFLSNEAKNSQFFLIGEPHGIAELPIFTSALFDQIYAHGYRHLAVETGPVTARKMEMLAAQTDGFSKFNYQYPFALPFFNWKEEAAFLEDAFRSKKPSLWGLDQEFMGSTLFHMERLYRLAPAGDAKKQVGEYYENAKTEFKQTVETRNPGIIFLSRARAEDFEKLDAAFRNSKNKEAAEILSELRASAEIYQKTASGKGYESNNQRAQLMKKHFMAYYSQAAKNKATPKVLFKFGANHMKRGRNFTNVYDIGNFAAEFAAGGGADSFHLLVVPTGGTQNAFFPFGSPETDKARKFDPARAFSSFNVSPLLKVADERAWSVVDLRPLRPLIGAGQIKDLPAGFADLVWGFDAVLLLPNVRASVYFEWKKD